MLVDVRMMEVGAVVDGHFHLHRGHLQMVVVKTLMISQGAGVVHGLRAPGALDLERLGRLTDR
jgi:hypothetical protein